MTDVEFLARPSFSTPRFIYRYRSGVLRAKVQAVLKALAEDNGRMPVSASANQFRSLQASEGFFESFIVSKWPRTASAADQGLLEVLSNPGGHPFAVLVSATAEVSADLELKAASSSCVMIEEQLISASTIRTYLDYLLQASDLGPRTDLVRSQEFVAHLLARMDGQFWDLQELIHEFDRAVVLHTDPQSGSFIIGDFDDDEESVVEGQLGRSLRSLLSNQRDSALFSMMKELRRRYRKDTPPKKLIASLSKISVNVLTEAVTNHSGWLPEPALWSALLLSSSLRLSTMSNLTSGDPYAADLFLADTAQLGRLFIERCDQSTSADPMRGLWSSLSTIVGLQRRPQWLEELVVALRAYLVCRPAGKYSWIERLAISMAEPVHSQPERGAAPQSLRAIVGNGGVIDRIAQRYLVDKIRKPLILSGPVGVGKFAVARSLARSLICEARLPDGMPCEKCGICADQFGGFGVFEIDARGHEAIVLSTVRKALDMPTFADHRVVIIENADAALSLDTFLKIMEIERVDVTFILCTSALEKLSRTIRSRSNEFNLHALQPSETRRFANAYFAAHHCTPASSKVLDILVALSMNLPGRLFGLYKLLGEGGAATQGVYDALDLRWGDWAYRYWIWLMKAGSRPNCEPPLVPVSLKVERLRLVLLEFDVATDERVVAHPALEIISSENKRSLRAVWQSRRQNSSPSLWFDLANIWLDETPIEEFGFRQLVSRTRRLF